MEFSFDERQQELAHRYREIGLRHMRRGDHEGFDWPAWRAVTDAGLWRLPVSRDFGGAGEDRFAFAAAFGALAGTMRSVGFLMAVANQATLIHYVQSTGTAKQRIELLPRLLDGELGATAISERGTGTEIRALQTTLTDDAHGYRLDGHKYNISLAPIASIMLVAARYGQGERTHTALVLLDAALPGIEQSSAQDTLGVRDLPLGEIRFDAVPVDREHLLGDPRDGLKSLMRIASMNRAYFALSCADVVQPFLADALDYAAERKILGVPIDTHQYVQRRLVDVRIRAERSRWMALAALGQLMSGHRAAPENCSIAKLVAAQDLTQSALDLLALHGSDGYRRGALATFVADALAMISAGGTEEMHRRNIFGHMQREHAAATAAGRVTLDRPAHLTPAAS